MEPHHQQTGSTPTVTGGGACLMLSMAAIGALYEFDTAVSKELFESAKRMIHSYLEQRRKADMTAAFHRSSSSLGMRGDGNVEFKKNGTGAETSPSTANGTSITTQNTPLWLVQAMLLNVIYGHNCGDKTSAETATTHCAALVSLARAADLTSAASPEKLSEEQIGMFPGNGNDGMSMVEDFSQDKMEWLRWKTAEERKRTLFAIFTLSSLLLSAYNHSPALMNSEIVLDMPCDEQLWAAGSPQEWMSLRSIIDTKEQEIPFPTALTTLLTTNQRERQQRQQSSSSSSSSQSPPTASSSSTPSNPGQASAQQTETDNPDITANLKPSTFGCLILIHALHNYIWETRQRHIGRPWTTQETEAMHTHIEPALRAWQCAWQRNPHHSLERPNPFGLGPLSADSIPLLDLAYVRLFVNLARSKEAFWQRDWERMAEELARGTDLVQSGDEMAGTADVKIENTRSPVAALPHVRRPSMLMDYGLGELNLGGGGAAGNGANGAVTGEAAMFGAGANKSPNAARPSCQIKATGRERHLRQAAFYAADSLFMSDKLGNTYAEFSSRELPLQSAMCAFDCAQVLAEWVTTVQERVGAYVGILGQDAVDFTQVPAVMFLEDEDFKLLMKIDEILCSVERKMATLNTCDPGTEAWKLPPSLVPGGYGIKILFSTAYLLDRAAVWPVTKLMVKALEVQALRARERAQASVAGGFAAYLPSSGTGMGW
ncbi:hypothetical protein KEM55_003041 [Ascosphaera atra]|nr:hypothetical protein KEM55_003041 [Ascosphaera atra]